MKREFIILLFVVFAVLFRVIPHPPNFVPITALALFGASTFKNKWIGLTIPLLAMAVSDLFLGFYSISVYVYLSFFAISLLGRYWKQIGIKNVFLSSLLFFIVTNFGVWLMGYPKTLEGFIMCYTLAVPFFGYSLMGDLFFYYVLKYSFSYTESKLKLSETIS